MTGRKQATPEDVETMNADLERVARRWQTELGLDEQIPPAHFLVHAIATMKYLGYPTEMLYAICEMAISSDPIGLLQESAARSVVLESVCQLD